MTTAFRLRGLKRGVAFSPTDIAGIQAWWDFSDVSTMYTDAGSTHVSSDGDLIYQITDKSGQNNTMIQTTSGNRPPYKVATINGLSTMQGNGGYDTAGKYLYGTNINLTSSLSYVCVVQNLDATPGRSLVFGPSANGLWVGLWTAGDYALIYEGVAVTSQTTTADTSPHVWDTQRDGTTATFYLDNTALTPTDNTHTPVSSGAPSVIGGGAANFGWDGYIGEIIAYNSNLDSTDRGKVSTYLGTKWGITVA